MTADTAALEATPTQLFALRSPTGAALIAATVLASTVGFYDAYVVNVAIPAIGRGLGSGVSALQWVLTSYLVTVAALLLLSGALADRFGRRKVLATGLSIMLVTSILCAIAPSVGVLIAVRLAQGVGGALVVPSSLSLLNGTLRRADRARAIGIWAALATLGTTLGPYVGGWLVDHASWHWVFVINVPLILFGLVALRWVPEAGGGRASSSSLDWTGAALAVLGLGGVVYALIDGPAHGWLSPPVLVAGAAGLAAAAALVPVERHRRAPMIRLSLFASRQFDAINVTTILFYGALAAAGYLLVLECQLQLGYSASQSGAVLLPDAAVFLLVSPLAGALVPRLGPRWLMVAGIAAVAAALVWLSQADADSSYVAAILPAALLWGVGTGLAVAPLTAAVLAAVADDDLGEASAVNDAASRLGGVIVIALIPALIGAGGHGLANALVHGYEPAMLVLAALCGVAAVATAVWVVNDTVETSPRIGARPLVHACALPTSGEPQEER